MSESSRFHLVDSTPLNISTVDGDVTLGRGWLVISEDEYQKLFEISESAREWIVDRPLSDPTSRALGLAVMEAFPEDVLLRESCDCGLPCDECLDKSQFDNELNNLRKYVEKDKLQHEAYLKSLDDYNFHD